MLKLSQVGNYWQAWKILASLANTGKPGKYWQAWQILASLENTGKPGNYWQAVQGDILKKE